MWNWSIRQMTPIIFCGLKEFWCWQDGQLLCFSVQGLSLLLTLGKIICSITTWSKGFAAFSDGFRTEHAFPAQSSSQFNQFKEQSMCNRADSPRLHSKVCLRFGLNSKWKQHSACSRELRGKKRDVCYGFDLKIVERMVPSSSERTFPPHRSGEGRY